MALLNCIYAGIGLGGILIAVITRTYMYILYFGLHILIQSVFLHVCVATRVYTYMHVCLLFGLYLAASSL